MEGFKKLDDDLQRVIEKDDCESSVTTESDESKQNQRTCREQLLQILQSIKFQIAIVCVVIFNCLIVITELLIDLQIFAIQQTSVIPKVLHFISIGIICLFLIEITTKVVAFRLDFFKHKMEVFDAIVVTVSFALDIAFANYEGIASGIGLLIVLRLWRITRILNGIVMSVKVQAERRLLRERRAREAVEQELAKFREYCTEQEHEIEALQNLLNKHGIKFQKIEHPVVVRTIDVVAEVNELSEKAILQMQEEMPRDSSETNTK